MKTFTNSLCVLLSTLPVMFLSGCNDRLEEGQAGWSYTENEDGELIRNDGKKVTAYNTDSDKNVVEEESGDSAEPSESSSTANQSEVDENGFLQKFRLINRSGKEVSSDSLLGQPYLVGFFFSKCPTICVRQNDKVQLLSKRFKNKSLRLLSISCDPEVDTPEVLTEYAERFKADPQQWMFLTGELPYIRRVGVEMFRLPIQRRAHPERFVLVDENGKISDYYYWSKEEDWDRLLKDLEKLPSRDSGSSTAS